MGNLIGFGTNLAPQLPWATWLSPWRTILSTVRQATQPPFVATWWACQYVHGRGGGLKEGLGQPLIIVDKGGGGKRGVEVDGNINE